MYEKKGSATEERETNKNKQKTEERNVKRPWGEKASPVCKPRALKPQLVSIVPPSPSPSSLTESHEEGAPPSSPLCPRPPSPTSDSPRLLRVPPPSYSPSPLLPPS